MDLKSVKIGFLGSGNIAKAIGGGLIKSGYVKAPNVLICAPSERSFADWKAFGAVKTTHDNNELIEKADIIFLCMKPFQFQASMENITFEPSRPSKLYVSTLAGTPLKILGTTLKKNVQNTFRLIRSMPNTPLLVGAGCTVLTPHVTATKDDINTVQSIFQAVGKCEIVSEPHIIAVGGVAGSSPAFIYVLIEAMADAGVKAGLPRAESQAFAAQAVMGAAKMVLESGQHPAQLKDAVCSPGGTTICGIEALEKTGLRASIMAAVEASIKRSDEMTKIYD